MLEGAPDKLNGPFSQVEPTGFAQGHFSVIYDRANGDLRLNVMVTTLPAVPDEGQLCSVCSQRLSAVELPVSVTLRKFGCAYGTVTTGRFRW